MKMPSKHARPDGPCLPAPVPDDGPIGGQWRQAVAANLAVLGTLLAGPASRPQAVTSGPPEDTPRWRQAVAGDLVSLNEILTELVAGVAADREFTALVYGVLRDCSWALGYEFRGEQAPLGWEPGQEAGQ